MRHSTPNRLGQTLTFFSYSSMLYRWLQKIAYTNFQTFLEIFLIMFEIVDLAPRAVIESFEIYTINSWIKNKQKIRD